MRPEKDDKYYNEVYNKYKHYGLDIDSNKCNYIELYRKVIEKLKMTDKILEIGCGTGHMANILIAEGYDYQFGFDFSEVGIIMCRVRTGKNEKFANQNVYDFDFNTVDFDTVISLEVFEHLDNDLDVLSRIPVGKRVIFSVPNFDDVAHVRYFKTIDDVKKRFKPLFKKFTVEQLGNIYIVDAKK
jgi:2-polyprenyl-3-methyl-5-hydroxy-6-metoxy-1,4-benzoquinol methylase